MLRQGALALALGSLGFGRAAAQSVPAYDASRLACVRFTERVESEIHGESGGRPRDDRGARFARWSVRGAAAGDSGTRIEAWFDSLSLSRTTGDDVRSPDTDGIVGGRYRGVLTAAGLFTALATPFVPPEVAEFADLRNAFADLLPLLPPRALRPGESWRAGDIEIERLGDSVGAGGALLRFRLERRATRRDTTLTAPGDTVAIAVRQSISETGEFTWDPVKGLVRRFRRVTVETDVPAGKGLRYPVRSRIVQRITLEREPDAAAGCS